MSDVLTLNGIRRRFRQGEATLDVLRGASLNLQPGEIVALVGPSGEGKSTLLHIAGLLERPDGGEVHITGKSCATLSESARTELRRATLGFVYQYHHLLPEFSALENVVLPQYIAGISPSDARRRAESLLGFVGLSKRLTHRPAELSGGEQQRVAIARSLANRPKVLLADEPTGNLDHATAEVVFEHLLSLVRGESLAALVATHNMELAARMDRILRIKDGVIVPG
ncbi:MAG: ABC transporter ATP-binding protein [Alphaproteobacteria bacterium]|nr:ABC transporter ATP-binding protein [Alphaproteobacteria bacterium]